MINLQFRQVPRNELPEGGPIIECNCEWDAKTDNKTSGTKSLAEMLLNGDAPNPDGTTNQEPQTADNEVCLFYLLV